MAHRPRTISSSLIGVLMIAAFVPFVIWLAVVLSSPIVWVALAIIACTSVALSVRHPPGGGGAGPRLGRYVLVRRSGPPQACEGCRGQS